MWEIFRNEVAVTVLVATFTALMAGSASAQSIVNQNISGFNLPGVQLPQGHDEVRAADGTTCRSAVSGSGAYLDVGVIGNPDSSTSNDFSHYGRVVIPLGKRAQRLDCTRLYDLEVQRLQMELRLMQMGLGRGVSAPVGTAVTGQADEEYDAITENKISPETQDIIQTASAASGGWDDEGWSTDGKND